MNTESMGTGIPGGPNAPGGTKVPIYELAKELGISNKDLVTKIRALGIEAKNHMSRLETEDVSRVRRSIDKERQENTVQEHLTDTVIRRRAKDGSMLRPQPAAAPPPVQKPVEAPPQAPTVFVRKRVEAAPGRAEAPSGDKSAVSPVQHAPAAQHRPHVPAQEVRPAPLEAHRQGEEAHAEPARKPKTKVRAHAEAPHAEAHPAAVVPPTSAEPAAPVRAHEAPQVVAEQAPIQTPVAPAATAVPAEAHQAAHHPAEPAAHIAPERAVQEAPGQEPGSPQLAETAAHHAGQPPLQAHAPTAQAVSEPPTDHRGAIEEAAEVPAQAEAAPPAEAGVQQPVAQKQPRPPRPPKGEGAQKQAGPRQQQQGQQRQAAPAGQRQAAPQQPAAGPPQQASPAVQTIAPLSAERVFVTAQTRRQNEGLGPTGRVIDLTALRGAKPSTPPAEPSAPRVSTPPRGPREEVTGERLRQPPRQMPQQRPQQKSRIQPGKKPKSTQITTAAEHKRVVRMGESIVINELARQMGLKATDVLKKIWELGMRSVMINSPIDIDTSQLVANEFDWRVESTVFQEKSVVDEKVDQPEDLKPRAPVITIMGHVDHGKTSLLDAIRNANVAGGEAGGITQHIGAYKVSSPSGDVVFLDTPGHEAFTEMRARGAQATDIVVLVVAADDGVMPQTLEALNHAKDAKVPIIVAVNKIDKPQAQPERIRQQLAGHGLSPEEWGGETIYVDVSARTRVGLDRLLEMLALQSEVLELKANPDKAAKGVVIEARMDAKRGPVASILVQEGALRVGDNIVVGEEMGKVRAMNDDKGMQVALAGPSTPVEVLGLSGVPRAGEVVNAVSDERAAKELVEFRRQRRIEKDRNKAGPMSLEKIMAAGKDGLKELKIILKADVQGSVEALSGSLVKLSTPQVKVTIIQAGVGGITETDVNLAKAGNAVILGFHVRPAGKASSLAEQEGVEIRLYEIIYEALDDVKKAMAGLLAPVKREKLLGKAEIRQVFTIPKVGAVAGCGVTEGIIRRNGQVRLVRDSVQIYQGRLASLRRFKDDVREVQQGYECGLGIEGYNDIKVGDVVECFEIEEIAATLA